MTRGLDVLEAMCRAMAENDGVDPDEPVTAYRPSDPEGTSYDATWMSYRGNAVAALKAMRHKAQSYAEQGGEPERFGPIFALYIDHVLREA